MPRRRRIRNTVCHFFRALQSAFTKSPPPTSAAAVITATVATTTIVATTSAVATTNAVVTTTAITNQHPSNPRHIPTEIILAFGEFLDKPSLLTCLQVCQQWNQALSPFVWSAITKQQWNHPSFPLDPLARLSPPLETADDVTNASWVVSCLRRTTLFEWSDLGSMPHCSGWRDDSTIVQVNQAFPSLETFKLMPRLTSFSLITKRREFSNQDLLSILTLPSLLQNLQVLVLDLPGTWSRRMNIESLYPLLSRLEELDLRGIWYRASIVAPPNPNPNIPRHNFPRPSQSLLMAPSAATTAALDNEPRWRIKKLTVDWAFVSLLAKCSGLQHLSFAYPVVMHSSYLYIASQMYLLPLILERMASLETISIDRTTTAFTTIATASASADVGNEALPRFSREEVFRVRELETTRSLWDRTITSGDQQGVQGLQEEPAWPLDEIVSLLC